MKPFNYLKIIKPLILKNLKELLKKEEPFLEKDLEEFLLSQEH
jgi:hypothetical protein